MIKDFPDKLSIVATCASGVESVLKKEIERMGFGTHPAVNGAITFEGSPFTLAQANICLRTAERVYIKVAEFPVLSFDEMFDGVKNALWESFIPQDGRIIVNGKCVKSKIYAISDSQKIIKKAIVDRLCSVYKLNRLEENGAVYEVLFSLFKDSLTLMINTSGDGLHKRGYRDYVGIAPIKETLASALLLMSDFYYEKPFCDPFCGSGTFVIEAARIALNIAPNVDRSFAFNKWCNFDDKIYRQAVVWARDKEEQNKSIVFEGYDIDPKAISLSYRHAERARVKNCVRFAQREVGKFDTNFPYGTIVTNPPYGFRIYDKKEAEQCIKDFGIVSKKFPCWSVFAISAMPNFEKNFGRRADRNRKIYNSNMECKYYYFYGKNYQQNDK